MGDVGAEVADVALDRRDRAREPGHGRAEPGDLRRSPWVTSSAVPRMPSAPASNRRTAASWFVSAVSSHPVVGRSSGIVRRMIGERPPVLVAPDSFKGTFRATEVAGAIGRGIERAGLVPPDLCPVADGGEGTLEVLLTALGGETARRRVRDPLGREVARRVRASSRTAATAVVEMAAASGLGLVAEDERDAWAASTYGTGELICAAVDAGAAVVLVAVGGSATTDGGAGAVEAIEEARRAAAARGSSCCATCARRSSARRRSFGPQKGADPDMVARLDERLDELAAARCAARPARRADDRRRRRAVRRAVGGLRRRRSSRARRSCSTRWTSTRGCAPRARVVTGEGRLDEQTLAGQARRRDRHARAPGRRAAARDRRQRRARPRSASASSTSRSSRRRPRSRSSRRPARRSAARSPTAAA